MGVEANRKVRSGLPLIQLLGLRWVWVRSVKSTLHHHQHQALCISTIFAHGRTEGPHAQLRAPESCCGAWDLPGSYPKSSTRWGQGPRTSLEYKLGLPNLSPVMQKLENGNIFRRLDKWIEMLLAWGHWSRNSDSSTSHMAATRPRKAVLSMRMAQAWRSLALLPAGGEVLIQMTYTDEPHVYLLTKFNSQGVDDVEYKIWRIFLRFFCMFYLSTTNNKMVYYWLDRLCPIYKRRFPKVDFINSASESLERVSGKIFFICGR